MNNHRGATRNLKTVAYIRHTSNGFPSFKACALFAHTVVAQVASPNFELSLKVTKMSSRSRQASFFITTNSPPAYSHMRKLYKLAQKKKTQGEWEDAKRH